MLPATKNRIKLIIEEFLSANNVSKELTEEFHEWFISPGHFEEKKHALEVMAESNIRFEPYPDEKTREAYKKVARKLGLQEDCDLETRNGGEKNKSLRRIVARIAAVLIPVVVILGTTFYILNRTAPAGLPQTAREIFLAVPAGEQKHTTLPDGSSVWINSMGEITYGEDFNDDRIVKLSGAAYFDVAGAEGKPFRVTSGNMTVTALGTIFSMNDTEDDIMDVSLYEGLLRVDISGESCILSAKHELQYNKLDGTISVTGLSRTKPDWMRNIMDFRLQPASDVLNSIGKIYGYSIHMEGMAQDKLAEEIVTLKFEEDIDFRDVLSIMSDMSGFSFTINDEENEVYITANPN